MNILDFLTYLLYMALIPLWMFSPSIKLLRTYVKTILLPGEDATYFKVLSTASSERY
jgi:hypothetical protein